MRFFWPGPLDLVDPTFDFKSEVGRYGASRQQYQQFPHEIFNTPLYHGFVVSKVYVERGGNCRWNASQLNRFYREGAKRFLRLRPESSLVMGDSGAYTRSFTDQVSSHLVDECLDVISFYDVLGVDYGLAPDNVIQGHWVSGTSKKRGMLPHDWEPKWRRTLQLAETFLDLYHKRKCRWEPIGVAQGWDPQTYQSSVKALQQIGYAYIALGGLNRLNDHDILACVEACFAVKQPGTKFHLLGVCRTEEMPRYAACGVVSFDSAMPVRQAINDDRHNYHLPHKNYLSIRVPQSQGSPRLKQLTDRGQLDYKELLKIEQATLEVLRRYDAEAASLEEVLAVLRSGILYRQERDYLKAYEEVLQEKPWKSCRCTICKGLGIEVVMLRNRERNLRRGFHNLYVLSSRLKELFPHAWADLK